MSINESASNCTSSSSQSLKKTPNNIRQALLSGSELGISLLLLNKMLVLYKLAIGRYLFIFLGRREKLKQYNVFLRNTIQLIRQGLEPRPLDTEYSHHYMSVNDLLQSRSFINWRQVFAFGSNSFERTTQASFWNYVSQ